MLQNLYKKNAFIVLEIPLLLGLFASLIQFSKNKKKAFNTV